MNYRESVISRVLSQLDNLLLKDPNNPSYPRQISESTVTEPNSGYNTPVWRIVARSVRPSDDTMQHTIPSIYVSFDGGRTDSGVNTYVQNKAERIGIRLEILLDSNRGAPSGDDPSVPKSLSFQTSDVLDDLDKLLNFGAVRQISFVEEASYVIDANIVEWGFDPNMRGTPTEVLIVMFEIIVSVPKQRS